METNFLMNFFWPWWKMPEIDFAPHDDFATFRFQKRSVFHDMILHKSRYKSTSKRRCFLTCFLRSFWTCLLQFLIYQINRCLVKLIVKLLSRGVPPPTQNVIFHVIILTFLLRFVMVVMLEKRRFWRLSEKYYFLDICTWKLSLKRLFTRS